MALHLAETVTTTLSLSLAPIHRRCRLQLQQQSSARAAAAVMAALVWWELVAFSGRWAGRTPVHFPL